MSARGATLFVALSVVGCRTSKKQESITPPAPDAAEIEPSHAVNLTVGGDAGILDASALEARRLPLSEHCRARDRKTCETFAVASREAKRCVNDWIRREGALQPRCSFANEGSCDDYRYVEEYEWPSNRTRYFDASGHLVAVAIDVFGIDGPWWYGPALSCTRRATHSY